MGTHPIFESDFDCLTENASLLVSLSGTPSVDLYAQSAWVK